MGGALFGQYGQINLPPGGFGSTGGNAATPGQPGIGASTGGITAGALPQSALAGASQRMLAPTPQMGFSGALGQQFGQAFGQQANGANLDLMRAAAPVQAQMTLQQQEANANAGLQNSALMSRLQQDQFAAGSPYRSLLFSMLNQGGF